MPYGVSKHKPYFGVGTYSGFGEVFDVNKNQWYQSPSVFSDTMDTTTNWIADEALGGVAATISSVNGELKILNNGATFGAARTSFATIVGKKYRITLDVKSISAASVSIYLGSTLRGYDIYASSGTWTVAKIYTYDFVAVSTTTHLTAYNTNTSGAISTWDNVAVFPIDGLGNVDISGATPITNSRNYLNAIVYADAGGQPTYVEQLPKIEYKDIIKANEYQGKNACTAWVNFDGTTTPPTIRDSFNVSAVIRTATGIFDVYFKTPMDNVKYIGEANGNDGPTTTAPQGFVMSTNTNKATAYITNGSALNNRQNIQLIFFGGKN